MRFETPTGPIEADVRRAIVAGWTGRDAAGVQHHIDELAAIGVAPPSSVPLYYRVSADLLTQAPTLQVLGEENSGEAEPLLVRAGGSTWLGLASDHTDRALEATSVAASKQVCGKPVSQEVWAFDEVADHLDALVLRCWIDGDTLYQDGTLAMIRPLRELIDGSGLAEGDTMLCGTLPALGGVRPARAYLMRLEDPVLNRTLSLDYQVETLPVIA